MKKLIILIFIIVVSVFMVSCGESNSLDSSIDTVSSSVSEAPTKFVDLVSNYKLLLDFNEKTFISDGIEEVKLDMAIDGDTIHVFLKNKDEIDIRFLGVDTPESTAHVDPWGVEASSFTKDKLYNATSIVIESADGGPAQKGSNGRYLAFVWYLAKGSNEYRNLNLELVQEGYSRAGGLDTKYADALSTVFAQALINNVKVNNSNDKDPNYVYGAGTSVTLKELKTNLDEYVDKKVTFEATVQAKYYNDAFVKYTDLETNLDYYIMIFCYQTQYSELTIGNRVRITGYLKKYDVTGAYQITDIKKYQSLFPEPDQLTVLETGIKVDPVIINASELGVWLYPGIEAC